MVRQLCDQDGQAEFHPAINLDDEDFLAVQIKMRKRGLRWLHRHGHLDGMALDQGRQWMEAL